MRLLNVTFWSMLSGPNKTKERKSTFSKTFIFFSIGMTLVMTQGRRGPRLRSQDKAEWGGCAQIAAVDTQPTIHLSLENGFLLFLEPGSFCTCQNQPFLLESFLSLEMLRGRHLLGRPALCWDREILQVSDQRALLGSQVGL